MLFLEFTIGEFQKQCKNLTSSQCLRGEIDIRTKIYATLGLYSEKLKEYDLGYMLTRHRNENFLGLFQERLGHYSDFKIVTPPYATDGDLKLIHTEDYIQRIERCESRDPFDTPLSLGLVRAAKLLAGAGKYAAEIVHSREYAKAFVIGGGVQHETRDREKGFGVFSAEDAAHQYALN